MTGMTLEKKYVPWKKKIQSLEKNMPLVVWSSGAVGLRSCGPLVLWSCGLQQYDSW